MNIVRTYKSVESRSLSTLRLKVMSKKATGWVVDGPVLEVTDFSHRKPIVRYSQAMVKATLTSINWTFVH